MHIFSVIEIHYNFDVDNMFWTEKWSLTAVSKQFMQIEFINII